MHKEVREMNLLYCLLLHVRFETIFVTANNQYAIEVLNVHVSCYLMKLFSIDELIKAVDYVSDLNVKEDTLQDQVLILKTKKFEGEFPIKYERVLKLLKPHVFCMLGRMVITPLTIS